MPWYYESLVMLINISWTKFLGRLLTCFVCCPQCKTELPSFGGGTTEKIMSVAASQRCVWVLFFFFSMTKIAFPLILIALGTYCPCCLFNCCYILKHLDVKRPIAGSFQKEQEVIPMPSSCPSFAIVEISENIRAKLYSLLCKLGKTNELPSQCHICH